MENRIKIKEAITEQLRMWREGNIVTENGTISILEQEGVENSYLAETLLQIIETLQS